jgi:hypothetical protein
MKRLVAATLLFLALPFPALAQRLAAYPVVVSFNSMCCGVPDSKPVMDLIRSFKKQHKIKRISVDSIGPMGREGEYYLAFRLKEMSSSQRLKFIQQLKNVVPRMTDRGSAEIKERLIIDKADLGSRTGITTLRL